MIKRVVKYTVIGFLLMIYINRALFVTPEEMSTNPHEVNSLAELFAEFITGESNNTDEDGDSQETCNSAKIIQPYVAQQFAQSLELWNKFSVKIETIFFPTNEVVPQPPVLGQIDHPPQA
jgi:hypothetical protein